MKDHPRLRGLPLLLGLGVLALAWLGPLPAWSQGSFAAHMGLHLAVVAVAAPLLALGLGGSRLDPARRWPLLFAPLLAATLDLVIVWAWHAPALHHLSRHHSAIMLMEQLSFLVAGMLVWLSAFGGDAGLRSQRRLGGMIGLLMTSTHMTLLGVLLALAPRRLYMHETVQLGGLSPEADQELGGVLMLAVGGLSYLIGGLVLLASVLGREPVERRSLTAQQPRSP